MQVVIKKVVNGYLISLQDPNGSIDPTRTYVATNIDRWSGDSVTKVLISIFEPVETTKAPIETPLTPEVSQ